MLQRSIGFAAAIISLGASESLVVRADRHTPVSSAKVQQSGLASNGSTPSWLSAKTGSADCSNNTGDVDNGCNAPNFVFLKSVDPTILQDVRYYTPHNFMGRRIEGYNAPECVLTSAAAEALKNVQADATALGYSIKVYDCYRPQRAVDDFVAWGENNMDTLMKEEFYPALDKSQMFPDYIAYKSGHSRGSTVDLTLVKMPAVEQEVYLPGQALVSCKAPAELRFKDNSIDMGTGFDCMDPQANTADGSISDDQKANRKLLLDLMSKGGFTNYAGEWWHFTLQNEPYPSTYFNFPIQRGCGSA